MQNVLIVGAGTGGSILLDLLQNLKNINIEAIIDTDENASGIRRAKLLGIAYGRDWAPYIHPDLDAIIDVTGDEAVFPKLLEKKSAQTVVIPGTIASLLIRLLEENHLFTKQIQTEVHKQAMVLEFVETGIICIDETEEITIYNKRIAEMTGISTEEAVGKKIGEVIPTTKLQRLLKTGQAFQNVKMPIGQKGNDMIVNLAPLIVNDKIKGSVVVFHDVTEVEQLTEELDRAKATIRALESTYTFDDIYGTSTDIMLAIEQAKLAAQNEFSVLLRGEAGTGKELFANAIHRESRRKAQPFIRVNCSAIESSLLEARLFGHYDNRVWQEGLLKEADKGTLFLDEIADLPPNIQQKLFYYLQTGEIYPLGSDEPVQLDVRLITSTAENLEKAIHQEDFIEQLYYVLNRISIQIPSLRNRKEDIPTIVSRLLVRLNDEFGMTIREVTEEAQALLTQYNWPGNYRELENVLSRAMMYMDQSESKLTVESVTKSLNNLHRQSEATAGLEKSSLGLMMDEYEKSVIEKALQEQQGNKSLTANRLGISLRSLYYKLEKFDLV